MSIFCWVLAGLVTLNALAVIGQIGQARKPVTRSAAVSVVAFNAAVATGLALIASGAWR